MAARVCVSSDRIMWKKLGENVCNRVMKVNTDVHYRTITTESEKVVRIGCASGFWGDTPTATSQLIHGTPKIHYLILDYLSEVTMSLLTAVQKKNPQLGFTPDFVLDAVGPQLKAVKEKGIKVISNAGGMNPVGCADALQKMSQKVGVDLKIGVVTGDGLMHNKKEIIQSAVKDMSSGIALPPTVHSMNAYLGAGPIVRALEMGADIVITGRCTDSALALAPLIHEFQWKMDCWNKLAAGSLAGHLIECGAQCTGGIFTDWDQVSGWNNNGFPIAQVTADGLICITKPEGTGGLLTPETVAEQLVYEIGDPTNYALPDVVCDFSQVTAHQIPSGVLVKGAQGKPAPNDYKISATYMDGWKCTAVCTLAGIRTREKGERTGRAILKRCSRILSTLGLPDFTKTHLQVIGTEQSYGAHARPESQDIREGVIWIACQHPEKKALEIFSREVASAGTGMAPGLGTLVGGRPKPSPLLKHHAFLYPKEKLQVSTSVGDATEPYQPLISSSDAQKESSKSSTKPEEGQTQLKTGSSNHRVHSLALTRSGDKGDACNIGVIAREPQYYPYLKKHLTEAVVAEYFKHVFPAGVDPLSCVQRWELPGIHGLNFLLQSSLGGGGIASLRPDPQGKAFGQILLDLELKNLPTLKEM